MSLEEERRCKDELMVRTRNLEKKEFVEINGYFAIVTDGLLAYSSRYKCRYLGN